VRALQALRSNRRERRERLGSVRAVIQDAERTGDLVIRAEGLRVDLGGRTIIRDLDLAVMRGDRVGIVGPNGCGKTTLLRLLLGDLVPDEGTVRHGTNLQIARFDQLHDVLDLEKSLHENVCDEGEWVTIGGERRHVIGYLQDFLFTSDQIRGPVKNLSGGERNRAQLARILARPCNVLVLDEPTNDLDVETLELLESLLAEFGGTLLLVSHDREFLDQVVTSTLVFEGESGFKEYGGGYADWVRERMATAPKKEPSPGRSALSRSAQPRRLSYQEKRELEGLPARIEALESERERVFAAVSAPDFYLRAGEAAAASKERLRQIEHELETAFGRWEQLERIADGQG
jgi:ATP-binding cassette subfamily F protein uup